MATVGTLQVNIGVDLKSLQKGLQQAQKLVTKFTKQQHTVKITANTSGLTSALRTARTQVNNLTRGNNTVNIRANTSGVAQSLSTVQNQVNNLTHATHTVQVNANVNGATQAISGFQGKLNSIKDHALSIGGAMTAGITAPIVAGVKVGVESQMDKQETSSMFDTVTDDMSAQANAWVKQYAQAKKLSETTIKKGVGSLFVTAKATGMEGKEAWQHAIDLFNASLDFSSLYNLSLDDARYKVVSGMRGETEPMGDLGVNLKVENMQKALVKAGLRDKEDKSTLSDPERIRAMSLITDESMKNQNAKGYYDKEMNQLSTKLKILKNSFIDMMGGLTKSVFPVIDKIVTKLQALIDFFKGLSDRTKQMIVVFALIAGAIGPVILIIGLLAGAFVAVMSAIGFLIPVFTAIGGAIAGISAPIWITIGAIVALVEYLIYLYNTNAEVAQSIQSIWQQYLVPLVSIFQDVWTVIMNVVNIALTWIKDIIVLVLAIISGNWSGAWEAIKQLTLDVLNGILVILGSVLGLLWNAIISFIQIVVNAWVNFVNLFLSIFASIAKAHPGLVNFANGVIQTISSMVLQVLNLVDGMVGGIQNAFASVGKIVDGAISKLISGYNKVATALGGKAVSTKVTIGSDLAKMATSQYKSQVSKLTAMSKGNYLKVPTSSKDWNIKAPDLSFLKVDLPKFKGVLNTAKKTTDKKKQADKTTSAPAFEDYDWFKDAMNNAKKADDTAKKAGDTAKKATDGVGKSVSEATDELDKMQQMVDKIADSLSSMADGFASKLGIFDKFQRKFTSMSSLLRNSRQRNLAYQEWSKMQSALLSRSELSDEMRYKVSQMGVDNLAELRALAGASSEDLSAWSNYNTNVERLSQRQAVQSVSVENIYIDARDKDYKAVAQEIYKELKKKGAI